MDIISKYFPELSQKQKEQFKLLGELFKKWNKDINVISRKDVSNLYEHHILHSLSIAKVIKFKDSTRIMDVGTGGGFPGIPLAILFPDSEFTLLDSIGKKIKVVTAVAEELELINVFPLRRRVEEEKGKYHFIVSRAVTEFPAFLKLTAKNIDSREINSLGNGILYLKGGDLSEELSLFQKRVRIWEIKNFFKESFFESKKIIYLEN